MKIDKSALAGCTSLNSLKIPFVGKSVEAGGYFGYIFGADKYYDNNAYVPASLKTVIITGGKSIDRGAFYYCKNITNIVISDSVKTIGYDSFMGCHSLQTIVIPKTLTAIDHYAFSNCHSLKTVYYLCCMI